MATTLQPTTATITQTITLTVAGVERNISFTQTILLVKDYDARVVDVPTSEVDLITLTAAAVGKGQLPSFNHFTIINRDDTNFVRLRLRQAGGDTVDFRLDAGDWMNFWNNKIEVHTAAGAFTAFVDWDTIAVQADTADVQLEYIALQV